MRWSQTVLKTQPRTIAISKIITFFLPIKPQPASRPRVTRYGAYHTKNYTAFKNEAHRWLKAQKKLPKAKTGKFEVKLVIICRKPKNPSNDYPVGDVDNYAKAYLDAITKAKLFWEDDIQIVKLVARKRYQNQGEEYGAFISINEIENA